MWSSRNHRWLFYLVEHNGHDEEVQQEALRGTWTIEVKENECKEQSEKLEAGVAEGWAQEFQSSDCRQENITAEESTNKGTKKRLNPPP